MNSVGTPDFGRRNPESTFYNPLAPEISDPQTFSDRTWTPRSDSLF